MTIDIKALARAILEVGLHSNRRVSVRIDAGSWSPTNVKNFFDVLLQDQGDYKLRLKGVRTDTTCFGKLGIERDTQNSGRYGGVPVVMTAESDFDTMEFVFEPAHR